MTFTTDPVFDLIEAEEFRQRQGLELIPSENYVSAAVLRATGSVLTNKYSEGYPSFTGLTEWDDFEISHKVLAGHRYYGGQTNVDRIERLAISRACRLFDADHANVQPHSGANANEAVYHAWCRPGDKILAMDLSHGGHLTHGAPVTRAAQTFEFIPYGTTPSGDIDYDELERLALEHRPRIILVGYSAFMKIPDFVRVAKIAQTLNKTINQSSGQVNKPAAKVTAAPSCLLMADMSHVAGLIAAGVHPNPLQFGFHVMTTTTHKTLRGPRGGLILSRGKVSSPLRAPEHTLENLPTLIDRAVFPGTQGGPLEHQIAAKAVAFGEALQPDFKIYAANILKNAKALAAALRKHHFKLVGGGTDNHLILIDIKASFGIDGKFYETTLDRIGITLNANSLPRSTAPAFRPDGVRLGTPAITTRGLNETDMATLADIMSKVAKLCADSGTLDQLEVHKSKLSSLSLAVQTLALKHPLPVAGWHTSSEEEE